MILSLQTWLHFDPYYKHTSTHHQAARTVHETDLVAFLDAPLNRRAKLPYPTLATVESVLIRATLINQ